MKQWMHRAGKDARSIWKGHHSPHEDVDTGMLRNLRPPGPAAMGYICPGEPEAGFCAQSWVGQWHARACRKAGSLVRTGLLIPPSHLLPSTGLPSARQKSSNPVTWAQTGRRQVLSLTVTRQVPSISSSYPVWGIFFPSWVLTKSQPWPFRSSPTQALPNPQETPLILVVNHLPPPSSSQDPGASIQGKNRKVPTSPHGQTNVGPFLSPSWERQS